jgi:hypothetical protein
MTTHEEPLCCEYSLPLSCGCGWSAPTSLTLEISGTEGCQCDLCRQPEAEEVPAPPLARVVAAARLAAAEVWSGE